MVDSYGQVLAEQSAPMTAGLWQRVSSSLPRDLIVQEPAEGCTGGTGFTVSVADGGVVSFALSGSGMRRGELECRRTAGRLGRPWCVPCSPDGSAGPGRLKPVGGLPLACLSGGKQ